ncbi:MAG: zf-HC2 domain-containing protein, partial [Candidatus Glassbacteria bacterium]|nr:zf-HC2 domain-containing protein [Candidatus Glassbacteria bacterium]
MEYECSELKALLDQAEDGVIPWELKTQVESHLESCRTCSAKLSGFLKIQSILTATVYGDPSRDNYLVFLSQVAGKTFSWGPPGEKQPQASPGGRLRMMLKIFAGFVVAAGLGISGLVVFGRSGCFHRGPAAPAPVPAVQSEPTAAPESGLPPPAARAAPEETAAADTPEILDRPASDPKAIYLELNRPEKTPASPAP